MLTRNFGRVSGFNQWGQIRLEKHPALYVTGFCIEGWNHSLDSPSNLFPQNMARCSVSRSSVFGGDQSPWPRPAVELSRLGLTQGCLHARMPVCRPVSGSQFRLHARAVNVVQSSLIPELFTNNNITIISFALRQGIVHDLIRNKSNILQYP